MIYLFIGSLQCSKTCFSLTIICGFKALRIKFTFFFAFRKRFRDWLIAEVNRIAVYCFNLLFCSCFLTLPPIWSERHGLILDRKYHGRRSFNSNIQGLIQMNQICYINSHLIFRFFKMLFLVKI